MPTRVVNVSWIYSNFQEAEDPPYDGYATGPLARFFIRNYNYILAKKIITFLRDNEYHPNLEYVTLLGNGKVIPASYYIYSPYRNTIGIFKNIPIPFIYNNRIASDFFYTSPNYDLQPDFKVGRLSVSTAQEAETVIQKIIQWQEDVSWDWFQNITVAGDHPDHPEEMDLEGCFVGELIPVDAINHNYFQGMNITKLFLTEDAYNKEALQTSLQKGNAGFFYMMAHGGVSTWQAGTTWDVKITADEILNYPENKKVPIIVSVACMSGAFDTHCSYPLYPMFENRRGQISLGESFLLSPGAGIAYVGTTRSTLGSPTVHLDDGTLIITEERGIAGMLTYFFEAYHNGGTHLGDLTNAAIQTYVTNNVFPSSPEKVEDFIVLMSFVLLGDPALELPQQQTQETISYEIPQLAALDPDGSTLETYSRPWYYINTDITIQITTDSPLIDIKVINIDNDTVVLRDSIAMTDTSIEYTISLSIVGQYLLRVSSIDGKEGWMYLTIREGLF